MGLKRRLGALGRRLEEEALGRPSVAELEQLEQELAELQAQLEGQPGSTELVEGLRRSRTWIDAARLGLGDEPRVAADPGEGLRTRADGASSESDRGGPQDDRAGPLAPAGADGTMSGPPAGEEVAPDPFRPDPPAPQGRPEAATAASAWWSAADDGVVRGWVEARRAALADDSE